MSNQREKGKDQQQNADHPLTPQQRGKKGDELANRTQEGFNFNKPQLRAPTGARNLRDSFDAVTEIERPARKDIPAPAQSVVPPKPEQQSEAPQIQPSEQQQDVGLKPSEIAQSNLQLSIHPSKLQRSQAPESHQSQSVTPNEQHRSAAPLILRQSRSQSRLPQVEADPTQQVTKSVAPPSQQQPMIASEAQSQSKQVPSEAQGPADLKNLETAQELASQSKLSAKQLVQEKEPSEIHMGTVGNQGNEASQQASVVKNSRQENDASQYSELLKLGINNSSPHNKDGLDQRTQLYRDYGSRLEVPSPGVDNTPRHGNANIRTNKKEQKQPHDSQVLQQWRNEFKQIEPKEQAEQASRQPSQKAPPQQVLRDGGNSAHTKQEIVLPSTKDQGPGALLKPRSPAASKRDAGNSARTQQQVSVPQMRDQGNQHSRLGDSQPSKPFAADAANSIQTGWTQTETRRNNLKPPRQVYQRQPDLADGTTSVQSKWLNPIKTKATRVQLAVRSIYNSTHNSFRDGANSVQSRWLNARSDSKTKVQLLKAEPQSRRKRKEEPKNAINLSPRIKEEKYSLSSLRRKRQKSLDKVDKEKCPKCKSNKSLELLIQNHYPGRDASRGHGSCAECFKELGLQGRQAKWYHCTGKDGKCSFDLCESCAMNHKSKLIEKEAIPAPQLNNYSVSSRDDKMVSDVLGTELVIDKCIRALEQEEGPAPSWPTDTILNEDLVQSLSFSKMRNELNQRAPRKIDGAGVAVPISLCSRTGWHSSKRSWRESEIQQELGPGISLYFKMLKYVGCLFFLFTLLSAFPMAIYFSGGAYEFEKIESQKWLSITNLGNLGEFQHKVCTGTNLPPVANEAAYLGFSCIKGRTLKGLLNFGLAYQENSCSGKGNDLTVITAKACSIGTMQDLRNELAIDNSFQSTCVGRNSCSLRIDYQATFSDTCYKELKQRQSGSSQSGPARVYALAICEQEYIAVLPQFFSLKLSREQATMAIVGIDVAIVLIFFFGILRLRFYEDLTIQDIKQAEHRIEDFSVHLESIPISKEKYSKDTDLLSAIIAPHLEDEVTYGIEKAGVLRDQALNLAQIVRINYGMGNHNVMRHLVGILDDIKEIRAMRKKMQNDPKSRQVYEEQMWHHYTSVTKKKEQYVQAKRNSKQDVRNAYITFKSLEGKEKALQAFDINRVQRFAAERICGLGAMFSNKKLLHTGFPTIVDTVDPENITWENLGFQRSARLKKWAGISLISSIFFVGSFLGIWSIQLFERGRDTWVKTDCRTTPTVTHAQAQEDFNLPINDQKGLINCYCSKMYDLYGFDALKILFSDNRKLCQEWYPYALSQNYLNYLMVAFIAGMNLLLQISFDWIGQFNRTKNQSDSYIYRMISIFIAQYINTAVVIIIVYHRFLASANLEIHSSVHHFLSGPFDEFSVRWYLVVGVPIVMSIGVQILFPHIGLLWSWSTLGFKRCWDRRCFLNPRRTRQIIQSDYENLYTGPKFLLHIRYAQILSTIFVTMTYSSGLPMLYFIGFISFLVTYWTDKFLVLRYFRKTEGLNKDLSKTVVNWLPLSLVLHAIFGSLIFSYPNILKTESLSGQIGNDSQYLHSQRIGQHHVVLFMTVSLLVFLLIIFERPFVSGLNQCWNRCRKCCHRLPSLENQRAKCDDLYSIMSFKQLTTLFSQLQAQHSRLRTLSSKDGTTVKRLKSQITRYMHILERNEEEVYNQIMELTDQHITHIANHKTITGNDAKIAAVLAHYEQATDINNPNRENFHIEPEMSGSIVNNVKTYDLSANPKYESVGRLQNIMDDTLGLPHAQSENRNPVVEDVNNQSHILLELMDIESFHDENVESKKPLKRNRR